MGTPFETVYDRALAVIKDYKLDSLAQTDYASFLLYWQSILEISVPDFTGCFNSLEYDDTLKEFNATLTNKEINILAKIMVAGWFSGQVQDVVQFQLHLQQKEFKHYAEGQNLKEKSEYLDRLREKYNQDIQDYQIENFSQVPFFNMN
jgi:hypothetical protein